MNEQLILEKLINKAKGSFLHKADPHCQFQIGLIYLLGLGSIEPDVALGLGWLKKVSKSKVPLASLALKIIQQKIDLKNEPEISYQIGRIYYESIDGKTDDSDILSEALIVANQWFLKAAEAGHLEAQFLLGEINFINEVEKYKSIDGSFYKPFNPSIEEREDPYTSHKHQAFSWLRMAALNGHIKAQCKLGAIYLKGAEYSGLLQEPKAAFEWYQKAANQNDDEGEFFVGLMHHEGIGVDQD